MSTWLWVLTIGLVLYVAVGAGCAIYWKSVPLGVVWPLALLWMCMGNVQ